MSADVIKVCLKYTAAGAAAISRHRSGCRSPAAGSTRQGRDPEVSAASASPRLHLAGVMTAPGARAAVSAARSSARSGRGSRHARDRKEADPVPWASRSRRGRRRSGEGTEGRAAQPLAAGIAGRGEGRAARRSRARRRAVSARCTAYARAGRERGEGRDAGVQEKKLEIVGIGYRAEVKGRAHFSLGYSHPIDFPLPDGIEVDSREADR